MVDGRVTPSARILDSRLCDVCELPAQAARGHVIYANGVQIVNAKRQLYSSTSDFTLAEQALAECPGLGDPNRPRMRLG